MSQVIRVKGYPLLDKAAVGGDHGFVGNEIAFLRALAARLVEMDCFGEIYPPSEPLPHPALLVTDDIVATTRDLGGTVAEMIGIVCMFIGDFLLRGEAPSPRLAKTLLHDALLALWLSFTTVDDTDVECHDTKISLSAKHITLRNGVSVDSFREHVGELRNVCERALSDADANFRVDNCSVVEGGVSYSEGTETSSGAATVVRVAAMLCKSFDPILCSIMELYSRCHPKDVVNQYENEVATLRAQLEALLAKNNEYMVQLAGRDTEAGALAERVRRLEEEKGDLVRAHAEFVQQVEADRTAWVTERSSLCARTGELEAELLAREGCIRKLRAEIARLEAENEVYSSSRMIVSQQLRASNILSHGSLAQKGILPRMKTSPVSDTSSLPGRVNKDPVYAPGAPRPGFTKPRTHTVPTGACG
jgi:hypothetical protein